jgi:DNA-binding LacI/PurR family transcriptional regulator
VRGHSDAVALGVMQTTSEIGLPVPRHPPVIGFGDSSLAGGMRPALTTVRQDVVGKGWIAALALTVAIGQSRSITQFPRSGP